MGISIPQLLIILLIVLILFGRGKLPTLAEDLGKSLKAFKKGLAEDSVEKKSNEEENKE